MKLTDEAFALYLSMKGCVRVTGGDRGYLQIQVAEADQEIAEAIAEYLDAKAHIRYSENPDWSPRPSYQIFKTGRAARVILKRILPELVSWRREEVENVLAY